MTEALSVRYILVNYTSIFDEGISTWKLPIAESRSELKTGIGTPRKMVLENSLSSLARLKVRE